MEKAIPFSENTMYSNLAIIIIPDWIAKEALKQGKMTQEQYNLKDTHILNVCGYWAAVHTPLKTTIKKYHAK
jgi:hypothetical protein